MQLKEDARSQFVGSTFWWMINMLVGVIFLIALFILYFSVFYKYMYFVTDFNMNPDVVKGDIVFGSAKDNYYTCETADKTIPQNDPENIENINDPLCNKMDNYKSHDVVVLRDLENWTGEKTHTGKKAYRFALRRVMAVPGDTVTIYEDGRFAVNGINNYEEDYKKRQETGEYELTSKGSFKKPLLNWIKFREEIDEDATHAANDPHLNPNFGQKDATGKKDDAKYLDEYSPIVIYKTFNEEQLCPNIKAGKPLTFTLDKEYFVRSDMVLEPGNWDSRTQVCFGDFDPYEIDPQTNQLKNTSEFLVKDKAMRFKSGYTLGLGVALEMVISSHDGSFGGSDSIGEIGEDDSY